MFKEQLMQHPSLAKDNVLDVLRLIRTPNVGPITFFHLIRRFGTAAKALEVLPELSVRGGRKTPLIACEREVAEKEFDAATQFSAQFVLYGSPKYPKMLHGITDPPPLISVIGNPDLWQSRDAIALVGSRNASANGCQFAHKLSKDLGQQGLLVVSGLARGIDTYVHKGSLASGTVGVIAGGIDNIYPPENEGLYKQMRESGAIISEQPFGSIPFAGAFPGRNRIIAGISLGTVVVEAALKSGSLITARFAMENNREVFAVPGTPLDPRSKGCNQLIRQGAYIVEEASDVISGISPMRQPHFAEPLADVYTATPMALSDSELEQMRHKIIGKLGASQVCIDELIEQCETSAPVVLTILLELELAGRLKRSSGNKVYLTQIMEEVI